MKLKKLKDFIFSNKTVLLRLDLNVPISNGVINDDFRIKEALPTIDFLKKKKARIIIFSHFGRVKSNADKLKYTLYPVFLSLKKHYHEDIVFFKENNTPLVNKERIMKVDFGKIILLENTRFLDLEDKKESELNEELAKEWVSWGDIFINDAFGTLHRKHTSNFGIAKYIKNKGIGLLVERELFYLRKIFRPQRPFVLIIGGAKINDKLGVIKNLLPLVDKLLIGGGVAHTILNNRGFKLGKSQIQTEHKDFIDDIFSKISNRQKVILPSDFAFVKNFVDIPPSFANLVNFPEDGMALDIGPQTISKFIDILKEAKTVVICGPVGVFEFNNFRNGTFTILKEITKLKTKQDSFIVAGGGDTVCAAEEAKVRDKFDFVSTGGSATLAFLAGEKFDSLEVITE